MRKYTFVLLILIVSLASLHADLMWTKEAGWHSAQIDYESDANFKKALSLMNAARLAQENGNFNFALQQYAQVCKKYSSSVFAPEAYFQIGKMRLERRQFNAAFKAFSVITKKYPEYQRFNEVLRKQLEIASMIQQGERPKYFGIIPGFKDYYAAIEFYQKIVDEAPFSDIAPLALYNIGKISIAKNRTVEAIAAFERLIDEYSYSIYAPESYLQLGEIYANIIKSPLYDQGATRLAINYYKDFLTLYPGHEKFAEAQSCYDNLQTKLAKGNLSMGDFYFNSRNNRKAAFLMYRKTQEVLPGSALALEAQRKIDELKSGKMPKTTPVDFLFGRYKRPASEQEIGEESSANSNDPLFETDFVRIGSDGDTGPNRLTDPDTKKPDGRFIEIGPGQSF